ncbi:ATP-dependent Clp protease ATP-binding subunit ClpX [Halorhodospira halochloris]|uniref:ATP-dependent Clp protease ATP-binding subunit ClpX n=1 Tax=Halorhodospira halochloris TaxID=1052 RepID=UPI001EE81DA3|nr:ATP-dependent Clp protease ATP-binding subunit ClpX [Halorhodospira halochloris]MCG5547348.1 ATP-dependent Clp protease ATP-binding subunit ClpX [Halorhodospira halochloris]
MRRSSFGEIWLPGLPGYDYDGRDLDEERIRRCSFCGQEEDVAGPLIGGEEAYICEHCLDECNEALQEDSRQRQERILETLPAPRALRKTLDDYVVGQERAKKVLAVAVYNHYKRLVWAARGEDVEIGKSNILLIGSSGTGKSYLASCLARSVDVPFAAIDATTLTASGYAGESVDSIALRLLENCGHDPEKASRGIVYIDEIDKLSLRDSTSSRQDVSGEGAQQALLKLIEGRTVRVEVPGRNRRELLVNTRDVLFICGGAFEGLNDASRSAAGYLGVGFTACLDDLGEGESTPTANDLQAFGLVPELVGRLPVVEQLNSLDVDDLTRILIEPRNALVEQYRAMLLRDGCELAFTDEALQAVARRAYQRGTGARGLRAVLEDILLEPMFAVPAAEGAVKRIVVDEQTVAGSSPIYEMVGEQRSVGNY